MTKEMIDPSCFVYCPKCSARALRFRAPYAYHCDVCDFTFYLNVAAATVAIIIDDKNRLLVATRANDPGKGTLDLPGGFADPDETGEEIIRREIMEETNLETDTVQYLFSIPNEYPYGGVLYRTLDMVFRCTVKDISTLKAADDVAALQWIPIQELNPGQFGLKSIREIVKRLKIA
jgi:8-oxo-dGTP pyrophosphatase MutT (NUDIX family)